MNGLLNVYIIDTDHVSQYILLLYHPVLGSSLDFFCKFTQNKLLKIKKHICDSRPCLTFVTLYIFFLAIDEPKKYATHLKHMKIQSLYLDKEKPHIHPTKSLPTKVKDSMSR